MDSIEIIDLGSPSTSCQDLANFPKFILGAVGGLLSKGNPIICGVNVDESDNFESICSFYEDGVWNLFHNMTTSRIGPAAASPVSYPNEAHSLFVTGGINAELDTSFNTGEVLTDAGWQEFLPDLPAPVVDHCMVLVNSTTVMIIGGIQHESGECPAGAQTFTSTQKMEIGLKVQSS